MAALRCLLLYCWLLTLTISKDHSVWDKIPFKMLFSTELAACLLFHHTTARETGGSAAYMSLHAYKNIVHFEESNQTLGCWNGGWNSDKFNHWSRVSWPHRTYQLSGLFFLNQNMEMTFFSSLIQNCNCDFLVEKPLQNYYLTYCIFNMFLDRGYSLDYKVFQVQWLILSTGPDTIGSDWYLQRAEKVAAAAIQVTSAINHQNLLANIG